VSADGATEHVLGNPDAPVTVLEYADFECPYCAAAAPVLKQLVEESDGRVRLVFRHFPLAGNHPHALTAALAAEAAGAQGAFWPMHDLLFARQDRLSDVALRAYAEELGLDGDQVVGETAQRFAAKVAADFEQGLADEVAGTPTVVVDGELFSGRVELAALRRALHLTPPTPNGSGADGGVDPGQRRQRRWSLGVRRAEREPLTEDAKQDDAEERRDH
jgi:protein-disulfide isomerase